MAAVVRRDGGRAAAAAQTLLDAAGAMLQRQMDRRVLRPPAMLEPWFRGDRHPLAPTAIRVERSRVRGERGVGDQTAVTVWFAEPPALPGPALVGVSGSSVRSMVGAAAGIAGLVALGALGVIANQREAERLPARSVPRLGG
jgi:hypothetical protein